MKGEYISIETSKIMGAIEKENKELQERIDSAINYIENNFITYKEANTYRLDIDSNIRVMISDFAILIDILKGKQND